MDGSVPEHSDKLDEIAELFTKGKTVLLHTGNQQEAYPIYARLAAGQMEKGKDTLILTPDIPSCRTMEKFLAPHFYGRLIAYHSGQSTAKRREATRSLLNDHSGQSDQQTEPSPQGHIIIGLRSALFLPMKNLGLIIVDQEHSPLYKQSEPTPRYHGRDTALILAQIHKANILLGSSTPSFESLANTRSGKYSEVLLSDTTSGSRLRIIDFSKEYRTGSTKGPLTNIALATLRESASKGIKCAIYRPKWAYPQLEEEWLPELEQALGGIKAEIFTQIHQIEALKTKPSLIVLLQGESLLSPKNFRAEERALQQIHTLTELTGMGKHPGSVIIQTSLFKHNVFRHLCAKVELDTLLHERSELNLPPYSRLIQITVREESPEKTEAKASEIANIIKACGASDFDGPIPVCPTEYIFQIKLPKSSFATSVKRSITAALYRFEDIIIDVDPQ
jgi:primosomal protein N'